VQNRSQIFLRVIAGADAEKLAVSADKLVSEIQE
jgi:hypothetical protein